jgi:(p)ppGpp synthase/HD superfamily hydrolase
MRDRRYNDQDLALVKSAYDLAARLFTAEFRGSGKPLLAHLIGTASVLCALEVPAPLLAAAVLHAAYIFGEFGDGRRGCDPAKRATVRAAVGSDIERIVMRYHDLRWNNGTVAAIAAGVSRMDAEAKSVLLIRLANELEDHLDLGVLYCGNAEDRRRDIQSSLYLCIEMSRALGQAGLAGEFQQAFEDVLTRDVPEVLRSSREYTYALPPLSHGPTCGVTIRRILDTHPRLARMLHPGKVLYAVLNSGRTEMVAPAPLESD